MILYPLFVVQLSAVGATTTTLAMSFMAVPSGWSGIRDYVRVAPWIGLYLFGMMIFAGVLASPFVWLTSHY